MVQSLAAFLAIVTVLGTQLSSFVPVVEDPAVVPWLEDRSWEEVVTLATWFERPILVDFTADWCVPCRRLEKEVYTDPAVVALLQQVLTYKVDADKTENQDLKQHFLVHSLPTLVLCRPNGEEIDRIVGYRPAEDFLAAVLDGLADRNTLPDLREQLREDPFDPFLLLRIGTKHARKLNQHQARLYLERALELDPDNRRGIAARALWQLGDLQRRLGHDEAAINHYLRILMDYPDSPLAERILPMVAYIQQKSGDLEGMVATYGEIARRHPEDISALSEFAWHAAEVGIYLEKATQVALKAVRMSDEDPDVMGTLALVYHRRGMHQQAIAWIKKSIAKEPDDRYYRHQLDKFTRAAQEAWP